MFQQIRRIIAAICAVVFLSSALISTTYAWQKQQQVLNALSGESSTLTAVELIKLEKSENGSSEEQRIPGAVFYLFNEDGTQVGNRYVTDEDGTISVSLSAGSYYFQEIVPSIGYTYDTDGEGNLIKQYPFTVTLQNESLTVKAYNRRLTGSLRISKTVENSDKTELTEQQKKTSFAFAVTFSDGGTYKYRVDSGEENSLTSGEKLYLAHGQTAVFDKVPVGVQYTVTEIPSAGYTVNSRGHSGHITENGAVASFVNSFSRGSGGSLTVTKEVSGEGADLNRRFTFTAVIGGVTESFTLKHGESKIFTDLPVGTEYAVKEELNGAEGYTPSVSEYSGKIISTESITLPFVNVYDPDSAEKFCDLTVTKEVTGEGADFNKEFEFVAVIGGAKEEFALKHGESKTFADIPVGTQFSVSEKDAEDYAATVKEYRGYIRDTAALTLPFLNVFYGAFEDPEVHTGDLNVTKEVIGENLDPLKEFAFEISFAGENAPQPQTFTLKAGESKLFTDIPYGVTYTVRETDSAGYDPIVSTVSGTVTVDYTDTALYNGVPAVPGEGSVTVSKTVLGENADPDKEFTFEITFSGENAPQSQTFTLKNGESRVFERILSGVTYTVREIDPNGYKPVQDSVSGTVSANRNSLVSIQNRVPDDEEPPQKAKLTVTKKLSGKYPESDLDKEFSFVLKAGGTDTEFVLKANESKEFELPAGTLYELCEKDYFADGYVCSVSSGTGTITGQGVTAEVINTYIGEEKTVITGEKSWVLGDHDEAVLPETITVRLKDGDVVADEKTVSPDENGEWLYSFTVPKYGPEGKEVEYTVEELSVDGFHTSYDGFDIINTFIDPIEADPPIVQKIVLGENAPDAIFEFVMIGEDNAPMPSGSDGNTKVMHLTGEGEFEFGFITFTSPGVYTYTISELSSAVNDWSFDTSTYTVIFTVTYEEGKLRYERAVEKDGEAADKVIFTNVYDKKSSGDTVTVSGTKTWNHGDNPADQYPSSIIVYIYADGELAVQRLVTAKDDWKYSMELNKLSEDGKEIVYTVDEAPVPGYSKVVTGYDLLNTYIGVSDDTTAPSTETEDSSGNTESDVQEKPSTESTSGDTEGSLSSTQPDSEPSRNPGFSGNHGNPPNSGDSAQTGEDPLLRMCYMMMILSGIVLVVTLFIKPAKYKGKHTR